MSIPVCSGFGPGPRLTEVCPSMVPSRKAHDYGKTPWKLPRDGDTSVLDFGELAMNTSSAI